MGLEICKICEKPARTLQDDPGGTVWLIPIPSSQLTIYICARCTDDIREFLKVPVTTLEEAFGEEPN